MPRKNKALCRFRGCEKPRHGRSSWCHEHKTARWDEREITISREEVKEMMQKVHALGIWSEKSADIIYDLCLMIRGLGGAPTHVWTAVFEAERWADELGPDANEYIDQIQELVYPDGKGI